MYTSRPPAHMHIIFHGLGAGLGLSVAAEKRKGSKK